MSAYLQRLYDAAAGAAAAVDARPAQRSSSPLIAVDQRLATATYAASFLLGLPGEADAEPGPAPEPEALALPDPLRRDAVVSRDQTPVRAPVRAPALRPAPAGTPVPEAEERVALRPRTDGDLGSPTRPAPSQAERPPAAEATRRREEAQSPPLAGPRAEPDGPAPLLHPVPAAAPGPLPPPAAPRAAEPVELAEQVRRLVREAMSKEVTRPGPTGEREGGTADSSAPASRPTTAEAISVIGPLDRPARATTLYGLRLR